MFIVLLLILPKSTADIYIHKVHAVRHVELPCLSSSVITLLLLPKCTVGYYSNTAATVLLNHLTLT